MIHYFENSECELGRRFFFCSFSFEWLVSRVRAGTVHHYWKEGTGLLTMCGCHLSEDCTEYYQFLLPDLNSHFKVLFFWTIQTLSGLRSRYLKDQRLPTSDGQSPFTHLKIQLTPPSFTFLEDWTIKPLSSIVTFPTESPPPSIFHR